MPFAGQNSLSDFTYDKPFFYGYMKEALCSRYNRFKYMSWILFLWLFKVKTGGKRSNLKTGLEINICW